MFHINLKCSTRATESRISVGHFQYSTQCTAFNFPLINELGWLSTTQGHILKLNTVSVKGASVAHMSNSMGLINENSKPAAANLNIFN